MTKLNEYNEKQRDSFIEAIKNLETWNKVIRTIAMGGVVFNDPGLDMLVSSGDDGEGEACLEAYNEGFAKGCELVGKTYDEVMDLFHQ